VAAAVGIAMLLPLPLSMQAGAGFPPDFPFRYVNQIG
jgi:hypothetical protein